jgi:hypothetical protein
VAGLAGLVLARGLVLAGAYPGPGRESPAVGKRVLLVPISEISSSALRLSSPGIVSSSATFSAKGAITRFARIWFGLCRLSRIERV